MRGARKEIEEREARLLSSKAALSSLSKGRQCPEPQCPIRTAYQHDRDRIIHSKAFRRLIHKTQVFISPTDDHYRTRLTHTLEVSQIGRTIARALKLNEDLTEAIALGHDLGHTPFGHAGEYVLDRILRKYGMSFDHNVQSLHVVDDMEKLNLTWEVRDGIRNHPWSFPSAKTMEGQIVRFADRIAYINHDIDDSIRSGILKKSDLPKKFRDFMGSSPIDAFVKDIIESSCGKDTIRLSRTGLSTLKGLYAYLFKKVYTGEQFKQQEKRIEHVITVLFDHYMAHPEKIPGAKRTNSKKRTAAQVRDFIAGMTDRYAVSTFEGLFVPGEWDK